MPNRLINQTSPYLLQHADNPVDWYPWGQVALEKAQRENKPIFLSIGYAACHWCHVMAHESFENAQIAARLNEYFVSIKVDREERPDLDSIYMRAVVSLTGQGGWPLSVFLMPDGSPFYGGTYFPPQPRYGMPSFNDVLDAVLNAWDNHRQDVENSAHHISEQLRHLNAPSTGGASTVAPTALTAAMDTLLASYDWKNGGWGEAPRFPQPMAIEFLLQQATRGHTQALDAACHALSVMAQGGMYDRVGGGFHRYSTDDRWLVPHFEKMLYDNALLAQTYLHAYQLTGSIEFRRTCEQTLAFVLREMAHPMGGFFSSLDADSPGGEGAFYTWTLEELEAAIADPQDRAFLNDAYILAAAGNLPDALRAEASQVGKNILQTRGLERTLIEKMGISVEDWYEQVDRCHAALMQQRDLRARPSTDDKVLTGWNALALRTFAEAARVFSNPLYLAAAQKNADFLLTALRPASGLLRTWREGQAHQAAFLEDYAGLINGLLALYQADGDLRWFTAAQELADEMLARFSDGQGGFFDTPVDGETLILRPRDQQDNAIPCGGSLAALALLSLYHYTQRETFQLQAESMLAALQETAARHPTAFAFWLQALDMAVGPVVELAVLHPPQDGGVQLLLHQIVGSYQPRMLLACSPYPPPPHAPLLLQDRPLAGQRTTYYLCRGFVCQAPVNTLDELRSMTGIEI